VSQTASIHHLVAREILDSRGRPTVEVEVHCHSGAWGRASVPSGASTGQFEAHELRDGDSTRQDGLGVRRAVEAVLRELDPACRGLNPAHQGELDARLRDCDGTPHKSRLGANALLGVSLAAARAAAATPGVPLVHHLARLWRETPAPEPLPFPPDLDASSPRMRLTSALGGGLVMPLPMVNMISGGLHAGRNLDLQDWLILPVGAGSYHQALDWIVLVYRRLGTVLKERGLEGNLVGDEGGYGPRVADNETPLKLIVEAIERAGLRPGPDVALGLDVASTHFFQGGRYQLAAGGGQTLSASGMVDLLESWVDRYPLVSIEDGCADDDWEGWQHLTRRLAARVQLIGDDLFVTNPGRIREGIGRQCGNSVLIKLNQIGTLSETLQALRLTLAAGYRPVVSARSGETEDDLLADLAVATGAGQIKIGSIVRSERLAKYNQLLRLEEQLGSQADWLGGRLFAPSTP
jgi:enolase